VGVAAVIERYDIIRGEAVSVWSGTAWKQPSVSLCSLCTPH